ncbi:MAG: aldo/keto reductase, partial [Candidatus Aminicenantes bacterium]|nr:aldo/keto reductase [Candidatus Aminicenantes bacterium]
MNQHKLQQRKLGGRPILLSPIGLGCWQFSRRKNISGRFWPYLEESEIRAVVRDSLAAGVNWFDTAEAYGGGESERMLAAALHHLQVKPDDAFIATKWMPYEVSLVSAGADNSVGINRTINHKQGGMKMDRNDVLKAKKVAVEELAELAKSGENAERMEELKGEIRSLDSR